MVGTYGSKERCGLVKSGSCQMQISHPTVSARTLSQPSCPNCATPMLIARIDPHGAGVDRRTFECANCHHSEIEIVHYAHDVRISQPPRG